MRGDHTLLMVGIQLINVKRIMELENYHLATSIVIFFFFFFPFGLAMWLHRILLPRPGTEPRPSAVKVQSPNHWTTRKFSIIVAT